MKMKYIDYCGETPQVKKELLNKLLGIIGTHEKWCTKKFDLTWVFKCVKKGMYENAYLNLKEILRCLENLAA